MGQPIKEESEHRDQRDDQKLQIGLVETWVEGKDWENVRGRLSDEFNLKVVYATRTEPKGRAKGGIITGVKKHLQEDESHMETENAQERAIKFHGRKIKILTVYVPPLNADVRENVWRILKDYKEEGMMIIGGDFNARTGEKERLRRSQDKMSNKAGRELLKIVGEKEWKILNGATPGDECGNYTFVGTKGNSVIDYAVVNRGVLDDVERFQVEEVGESDHKPIRVTLKEKVCGKEMEDLTQLMTRCEIKNEIELTK